VAGPHRCRHIIDPRSASINTEMGAMIDSPDLGEDMRRIILRDMGGDNAWPVQMDQDGEIFWQNDEEMHTKQPARASRQRVMNKLMKLGPTGQY
jgi:phosphatidylserine/phosphatidylglycerophosphate/cardiolipin synthase-like enzyme